MKKKNLIIGIVSGILIVSSIIAVALKARKKTKGGGDFWEGIRERIKIDSHLMNIGDTVIYNLSLIHQPYSGSKYTKIFRSSRGKELQEIIITPLVSSEHMMSDASTLVSLIKETYKKEAEKLGICVKIEVNGEKEVIPAGNNKLYTKHIEVTRVR